MNKKSLIILTVALISLNTAWGQCTKTDKQSKRTSLFMSTKGAGHYVKSGEALYAGIMVSDEDGKPKVANVNGNCSGLFENGDVILTINNAVIKSRKEWENALKHHKEGEKVQVKIERGAKQLTVDVVLEKIDVYKSVI